jgi:hypothetical protein
MGIIMGREVLLYKMIQTQNTKHLFAHDENELRLQGHTIYVIFKAVRDHIN